MSVLQEYKCPCCGGAITFDSTTQNMLCPYCGTQFDVQTLASYDTELKSDTGDDMQWQTAGTQWHPAETAGLISYICNSCGGEIVGDSNTAATACPFCDNPVLIPSRFSGDLRPDLVIPFRVDKEQAKAALRNHYKGKLLLPKVFKDENHIDEIKGIYVPFWLFDANAKASIRYKATRHRTWSDAHYIYTETSFFAVRRSGTLGFAQVPVDGSEKIDDTLMESIEPFDAAQAVPFHTAYLSGYLADKYDVAVEQSINRANQRIRRSTEDAFAGTVMGYSTVIPEASSVTFQDGVSRYALYPVWLLNTTWKGQKFTFAVNGQTGKLAGDLPVDKSAYKKWLFGLTAAISAAAFALSYLVWLL